MHTFLDNFHQGGKYSAKIASHHTELIREENFTDQKSLSILSLQTDFLIFYRRSGCGRNSEIAKTVQTKSTFCGDANQSAEKCFNRIIKEKDKSRAAGDSDNRQTELTPQKCFRFGSEDILIAKCPKPLKENKKWRKQVRYNDKCIRAYDNGKNNSDQNIYEYMAGISGNDECNSGSLVTVRN